jgi:ankyrin repeat protein
MLLRRISLIAVVLSFFVSNVDMAEMPAGLKRVSGGKDNTLVLMEDATLLGDVGRVRKLLEDNPSLVNDAGREPILFAAIRQGHTAIAELFIDNGADLNVKDRYEEPPLHAAAYQGHKNMVDLLIEKWADVNQKGPHGELALHWAAAKGHGQITQLLVEAGTEINTRTDKQRMDMDVSAETDADVVSEQLKSLADEEKQKQAQAIGSSLQTRLPVRFAFAAGDTALHSAAQRGHKEIVELLLANGADVNITNQWGQTPLHYAVVFQHEEIAKALLNADADPNAKMLNGITAHDLASKVKDTELANMLGTGHNMINTTVNKKPAPDNSLEIISVSSSSPAILKLGEKLNVDIRYQLRSFTDVQIWARPYTKGKRTSGYKAHGSKVYHKTDSETGIAKGYFFFDKPATVDEIRVRMEDKNTGKDQITSYKIDARWIDVDSVYTAGQTLDTRQDDRLTETQQTRGKTLIPGTYTWDIEKDELGRSDGTDLWWKHVSRSERYLVPQKGAEVSGVLDMDFEAIDLQYLKKGKYSKEKISGSDDVSVLIPGAVIAVKTSEGNFAKIKVIGFRGNRHKYNIELEWVLFRNSGVHAQKPGEKAKNTVDVKKEKPELFTLSDKALMSLDVYGDSTARVLDKRDTPGLGVEFDIYFPPGGYSLSYSSSRTSGKGTLTHIDLNEYIGYALKFTLIDIKSSTPNANKARLAVVANIGSPEHYRSEFIDFSEAKDSVISSTGFEADKIRRFDYLGFNAYLLSDEISNTDGLTITIKIEAVPGVHKIEPTL